LRRSDRAFRLPKALAGPWQLAANGDIRILPSTSKRLFVPTVPSWLSLVELTTASRSSTTERARPGIASSAAILAALSRMVRNTSRLHANTETDLLVSRDEALHLLLPGPLCHPPLQDAIKPPPPSHPTTLRTDGVHAAEKQAVRAAGAEAMGAVATPARLGRRAGSGKEEWRMRRRLPWAGSGKHPVCRIDGFSWARY